MFRLLGGFVLQNPFSDEHPPSIAANVECKPNHHRTCDRRASTLELSQIVQTRKLRIRAPPSSNCTVSITG